MSRSHSKQYYKEKEGNLLLLWLCDAVTVVQNEKIFTKTKKTSFLRVSQFLVCNLGLIFSS
jgi:hypothetical protein